MTYNIRYNATVLVLGFNGVHKLWECFIFVSLKAYTLIKLTCNIQNVTGAAIEKIESLFRNTEALFSYDGQFIVKDIMRFRFFLINQSIFNSI